MSRLTRPFVLCLILISAALAALAQSNGKNTQQSEPQQAAQPQSKNSAPQAQGQQAAQAPKTPSRLRIQRMHDPNQAATAGTAPPGAHLSYFDGPVISNVHVVQVLYGAGSYDPQVAGLATPSMGNFYSDITASSYMDMLSEYNTSTFGTNQTIGRGVFDGLFQIVPSDVNNGPVITDDQIQAELLAQISAGHLPAPQLDSAGNVNTLYMIFFPPGQTITLGFDTSCVTFCAYHGTTSATFDLKHVLYGVHPDMQAGSGCDLGCGFATTFGNYTSVTSHELAEAITDADVGIADVFGPPLAWIDPNFGEIGDICNGQTGSYIANGTTYRIQKEFSNAANDCVLPPVATTPDFLLSPSPANVTVAPGSSSSSSIAVNGLGGFTGSVTLSVSGLPSGVTASFGTNPATSSSVLTFTATSAAPTSKTLVTITGTSGTLTHSITILLKVAVPQPKQVIINPGFENGGSPAPWTATLGVINSNRAEPPHSGNWDAWLDGFGHTHTDSISQTVILPGGSKATLSFWLHIDTAETTRTAANDTLQLQVLDAGTGAVLANLGTFSNLNAAPGYQQHSFDVSSFLGLTVTIRFVGQENSSRQTSFVIDDTSLIVQ